MSDVVMVYVREDIERAEKLAEMFDDFGFTVSCDASDDALARCGASIVVWTEAAAAAPALSDTVARAIGSGKAVALKLSSADAPPGAALAYDLTTWSGDPEDPALDAMFFALDRMVVAARAARPVLQQLSDQAEAKAAVKAEKPPVVPRAAPTPRMRTMVASLAAIGVVLAGSLALGRAPEAPVPVAVVALPAAPDEAPRVTLTNAEVRGPSYDLTAAPVEDATVGRRGLEPPSAASVRRVERTPAPIRAWEQPAAMPSERSAVEPVAAAFVSEAPSAQREAPKPKPERHI